MPVDGWRITIQIYGARPIRWEILAHGDPVWANWYMGGNWLCQHLWEHYAFTGDKKFLATKAYPVMKGGCTLYHRLAGGR